MPEEKTNVMRLLDQKKIAHTPHHYPHGAGAVDAAAVAGLIGMDPFAVFKTLVTQGASKSCYVFVIPGPAELDLKKAAKAVGEKSVQLLPLKDLTPLTGYVRGGCSPLGMKKRLPTAIHQSALDLETVTVSAGRVGFQVELAPETLAQLAGAKFFDLTVREDV